VRLGFGPVAGIDADRAAIAESARNARANGVELALRHADLRHDPAPTADVVAANLTASLLESVARSWTRAGVRPGTAIVSGLLREEADRVRSALAEAGLAERRRVVSGDWAALLAG
jgi:ribosomal protein L11 methylase PrmA